MHPGFDLHLVLNEENRSVHRTSYAMSVMQAAAPSPGFSSSSHRAPSNEGTLPFEPEITMYKHHHF
jgi:hypothetical protein